LRQIERIAVFWGLGYQILDDLKDVLQSAAETGKTSARDIAQDRPNIAAVIGIRGAVVRLTRLIDLGDKVLLRILESRPELEFLNELRGELQAELDRVTRRSFALAERGSA
jgi:geranylgeranyl pyrophosphate synthase